MMRINWDLKEDLASPHHFPASLNEKYELNFICQQDNYTLNDKENLNLNF
jgi:hypothetical protein